MNIFLITLATLVFAGCSEHQHDESCESHGGLHVHEPLLGGQLIALGDHGSGYN